MLFYGHYKAKAKFYPAPDSAANKLISYNTEVIVVSPDGWLTVNGLYSATTRKHIGWFMKEYGLTYNFAKQLYNDNMIYNIFTGEVKERG